MLMSPRNILAAALVVGFCATQPLLAQAVYGSIVGWGLRLSAIVLVVYVGLLGLTGVGMARIPSGFVPIQDKGYFIADVRLPDSASQERTVEATAKVEQIALQTPGVAH